VADELETIAEEDLEGRPGLPELLDEALRGAAERTQTCAPGIARAVTMATGKVSAQQAVTKSGEADEPIVPEVPLLQLGGALGYLVIPLSAGDACLLLHAHRSLDEWSQGDGKSVSKAADPRSHDPSDAVALPFMPKTAAVALGPMLVGSDVRLGAEAAVDFLVKGTALKAAIAAIGPPTSSPAVAGATDTLLLAWCASLYAALGANLPLSTKVKVG
jgi:hypothetical protein